MGRNITIKDIAQHTGLSITTVSRALNSNYPVSSDARKKIEEAVSELGYRPNLVARSLKSNNTNTIGFVVADISNPFFMKVAKGLEEELVKKGYQIILASSDGDAEKERDILRMFLERRIDALVLASSDTSAEMVSNVIDSDIPVILVDRIIEGINVDVFTDDNYNAAFELTKLLIEQGHRDIAFANVMLGISSGKERLEGALSAMKTCGIPVNKEWISESQFTSEEAEAWIYHLFAGNSKHPTSIFCANNIVAEGVMVACKALKLRIPEDISVVSYGEISMQALIEPKITHAKQEPYVMGGIVAKQLLKHIRQREKYDPVTFRMPVKIIVQGSIKTIK